MTETDVPNKPKIIVIPAKNRDEIRRKTRLKVAAYCICAKHGRQPELHTRAESAWHSGFLREREHKHARIGHRNDADDNVLFRAGGVRINQQKRVVGHSAELQKRQGYAAIFPAARVSERR